MSWLKMGWSKSISVSHGLTFFGVKREMVVFFLFLKSQDSLGGGKQWFSILIARKAKTVFFFCVIKCDFVDNKQNSVNILWNDCFTFWKPTIDRQKKFIPQQKNKLVLLLTTVLSVFFNLLTENSRSSQSSTDNRLYVSLSSLKLWLATWRNLYWQLLKQLNIFSG